MISGPTLPRTREALWSLVVDHVDRIERGLVIVHEDVCTEDGVRVDALARDANGHPVLLFLWLPDAEPDFVRRSLTSERWFAEHRDLLLQSLWLGGVERGRAPRIFVVGFDLPAPQIERLRVTALPGMELYQFRGFTVGGLLRIGVVPLLGPAAAGDEHSFEAPAGLADPTTRTFCTTLLAWIRKLEPTLQVQGDRYSRRFLYENELLAELLVERDQLRVLVPGLAASRSRTPILSLFDLAAAFDTIARRYLTLVCGEDVLAGYGIERPAGPQLAPVDAEPANDAASGGMLDDVGRLRTAAGASRIAREEVAAFGTAHPQDG